MATTTRKNSEILRTIGKDALAHAFRAAALRCVLKYGLTADDIEDAATTIAREIDAYSDEQDAA